MTKTTKIILWAGGAAVAITAGILIFLKIKKSREEGGTEGETKGIPSGEPTTDTTIVTPPPPPPPIEVKTGKKKITQAGVIFEWKTTFPDGSRKDVLSWKNSLGQGVNSQTGLPIKAGEGRG